MQQSRHTARLLIGAFLQTRARCRPSMCVLLPLARLCSRKPLSVRSLPAALLRRGHDQKTCAGATWQTSHFICEIVQSLVCWSACSTM